MSSYFHRVLKQAQSVGDAAALDPAPDYNELTELLLDMAECTAAGCDWTLAGGIVSAVPHPGGQPEGRKNEQ